MHIHKYIIHMHIVYCTLQEVYLTDALFHAQYVLEGKKAYRLEINA